MEIQNYADWSLQFHRRKATRRIPLSGSIELTRRCNQTCVHCYNNLPADDRETRQNELSFGECCRILDEITTAGCLWLLFTGGEIFVRPDLLAIYAYAKQKGLLITLFTNGTLITPAIADVLATQRPYSIEISLYGRTRETHERITGVPGSYERTRRGIRLLLERGLTPIVKTMVLTLNRHEVRDMQRMVEEELGLEFRYDAMINPRIDCSQVPLNVRLKPEEIVALDLQDHRRTSEWVRFCRDFPRPSRSRGLNDALFDCGGGVQSFAIDPAGRLSNCLMWTQTTYNLREGTFKEGWDTFLAAVMEQKSRQRTKCSACGIKDMCGMCPANGALECLDPETPVDFLCRVAHLRAYALDIPVPPHGDCAYCEAGGEYDAMRKTVAALCMDRRTQF
jgi:radical SAM protein with 4Fe4S-binding SPASM domain